VRLRWWDRQSGDRPVEPELKQRGHTAGTGDAWKGGGARFLRERVTVVGKGGVDDPLPSQVPLEQGVTIGHQGPEPDVHVTDGQGRAEVSVGHFDLGGCVGVPASGRIIGGDRPLVRIQHQSRAVVQFNVQRISSEGCSNGRNRPIRRKQ